MFSWTRKLTWIVMLLAACGSPAPPVVSVDAADVGRDEGSTDAGLDVGTDESNLDMGPGEPRPDGAPCQLDTDCVGGTCKTGDAFPGGFCTNDACDGGCGDVGWCSYSTDLGNFCAPICEAQDDCRDGYACRAQGVPLKRLCTPIRGADDGEACETGADCQGGTCLPWADGYCTTNRCDTDADCASLTGVNNTCVDDGAGGICLRACASDTDCRVGFQCEDPGIGAQFCLEDVSRPFADVVFEPGPLDIQCGVAVEPNGRFTFDYDIALGTTSYQVVPMARDGAPLTPLGITVPDGREFNFVAEREFMRINAAVLFSMSPTTIPPAPAFAAMLEPGTNTFRGTTTAGEVCYYLIEADEPGSTLDLNVYLVGVPDVTAATAATDPDFAAVFAEVERIFAQAGIQAGAMRYFDVASDDLAVVRDDRDIADLVRLSTPPGPSLDEHRGVNLFFVRQFLFPNAVVGSSTGVPGAVGLHGTHGSGLVFTSEYMGGPAEDTFGEPVDGNTYTGLIVAHELGHWLGLLHTTERDGTADPLDDTGDCGNPNLGEACPDWGNLMFPFARGGSSTLTADQAAVMHASPALRP